MIEELIKLLRKAEGELEDVLADLHHLRAFVDRERVGEEDVYILEVLDRIIDKVGVCP